MTSKTDSPLETVIREVFGEREQDHSHDFENRPGSVIQLPG